MIKLLSGLVINKNNPFSGKFLQYAEKQITIKELHKFTRTWMLKRVQKYKHQIYPLKPSKESKVSMDGWATACNHITCINASNKFWLKILLEDLENNNLEVEQGKIEEIQELLNVYPGKQKKIAINV